MSVPIPQPFSSTYGEIYQLNILGTTIVNVNSYSLTNEISDESRFKKHVAAGLFEVRNLLGDGLFTVRSQVSHFYERDSDFVQAFNDEPEWGVAVLTFYRLLMPAFGPVAMKGMMEGMRDICDQLILKMPNLILSGNVLDQMPDRTSRRLHEVDFDTIAYCSMSYRMNSFYSDKPIPLSSPWGISSQNATCVPSALECFRPLRGKDTKYYQDIKVMKDLSDEIVAERQNYPNDKKDLLNTMLHATDSQTGRKMSARSIAGNVWSMSDAVFLLNYSKGHETSSGTFQFTRHWLTPAALRKVRAEIDQLLGDRPASVDDLSNMPYLTGESVFSLDGPAVMRETLRLSPTAAKRGVTPIQDTTIGGGKYFVKAGTTILVHVWNMHRDPAVWGEDAEEFRPERLLDGKFEALPVCVSLQIIRGVGLTRCTQPNAWQPFGFGMRGCIGRAFAWQEVTSIVYTTVDANPQRETSGVLHSCSAPDQGTRFLRDTVFGLKGSAVDTAPSVASNIVTSELKPLYVFYGSNTGTSEAFAQRIANEGPLIRVDQFTDFGPGFRSSIGTLDSALGHVPTDGPVVIITASFEGQPADNAAQFVDWLRSIKGNQLTGVRFAVFGCGNSDWATTFQAIPTLCDELFEKNGATRMIPRGSGVLTKSGPVKRHIEFELPEGVSGRAGDYVAILPQNPARDVHRVLAHFGLSNEEEVFLSSLGPTSLPTGKPVKLWEILTGYVELAQPATSRDLGILSAAATTDSTRLYLDELKAAYPEAVLAKRLSVMHILESLTDIDLTLGSFLQMLPAMRVRQYSISSSPLWNPSNITITMAVRPSAAAFHPPADPKTPVVMFCAGSGIAPMRGFIQERAAQKTSGRDVGKMLLFFGCRSPEMDFLYSDTDLAEWIRLGVLDVRPAFSRASGHSEGCKYVQDRILKDSADIIEANAQNAAFFTCGSGAAAKGIKATLIEIIKRAQGTSVDEATARFEKITKGRYATDIFD
ncbi:fatty acid hydroxylase [Mycena polygramma]|nr:fatty acid hydroxylase [Mycena polygramma]